MFFFRLLQKLAHNLYTPHTLAERFKDPALWTKGFRFPAGSITHSLDGVGGIAWLLTTHTRVQLPRIVALHQRLTSMRYWYALYTSISVLSMIFFCTFPLAAFPHRYLLSCPPVPKDGYAVPKVCDWMPSFAQSGCRSSLSTVDRLLEILSIPTVVIAELGAIPGQYIGTSCMLIFPQYRAS